MKKILVLGLVLAMMAIMVAPMAAFADTVGYTTAKGDVGGPSIAITAPILPDFLPFVAGPNNVVSSTDGTVTVTPGSDGNTNWTVTAVDTRAVGAGYMWLGNIVPGTRLAEKFQISPDNWVNWNYADAGITYTGTSASGILPLYAQQILGSLDTTPGAYYITITFTGSCAP
jgi:hypothetical protein